MAARDGQGNGGSLVATVQGEGERAGSNRVRQLGFHPQAGPLGRLSIWALARFGSRASSIKHQA